MKEKDLKRELKSAEVHTNLQSFPIMYERIMNCYEKGNFYCIVVLTKDEKRVVWKHPINSIFRIREDYD